MRTLKRILLVTVVLLAVLAGLVAWKIGARNVLGMIRYDQRKEGSLQPGNLAPDVELVSLDGKTPLRLAQRIGGKPLVLVFGSYT